MDNFIVHLLTLVRDLHARWYNEQTERARRLLENDVRRFGGSVDWSPVDPPPVAAPSGMPVQAILADLNRTPKDTAVVTYRGFVMTHAEAERHRAWDNLMACRARLREVSPDWSLAARLLQE